MLPPNPSREHLRKQAKRLAKEPGGRKAIGLCLLAGVDEGNAALLELALSGSKADEAACRKVLAPFLADADELSRAIAALVGNVRVAV